MIAQSNNNVIKDAFDPFLLLAIGHPDVHKIDFLKPY